MQLDLQFLTRRKPAPKPEPAPVAAGDVLMAGGQAVPVTFFRSQRARRYILRLKNDGTARVTVPWRGSLAEGRRFAERQTAWLERQLVRLAARPVHPTDWRTGGTIYYRGEQVLLEADASGRAVRFADQSVRVTDASGEYVVRGLPAGQYRVVARRFGYNSEVYDNNLPNPAPPGSFQAGLPSGFGVFNR